MKFNKKHLIVSIILLLLSTIFPKNSFSQTTCTNVTITALGEPSLCRSSGKITISVSGADKNNLDLITAKYQILSVGQGYSTQLSENGGVFENVPPGEYNIVMKAFCYIAQDWSVYSGKVSVKIEARYIEPNMYIATEEVRKTLNCKVTGMIPVSFFDGRAPYTATITSWPAAYNGPKEFTRATSGRLQIDNLPEGNYTLSLKDDCGTHLDDLTTKVGKVSSDFPTGGYVNYSEVRSLSNNSTTDCKTFSYVYLRFNPAISESHELYPYLKDASTFYDIFLSEENRPAESKGTLSTTSLSSPNINYLYIQNISLIQYTFKDLYPAGGKKADLFLRVKDCSGGMSPKFPFSVGKPYYSSLGTSNFTCTGFDLYASQYTDYDGIICYPYTAKVFNADNGALIASKVISSSSSAFVATIPYGKFKVQYIGNDGGEWFPSSGTISSTYTMNAPTTFTGSYSRYSYCREDGITGYIRIYIPNNSFTTYFIPGTKVKVLSAPPGQVIPPEQTISSPTLTYFYPYSSIVGSYGDYSKILPGEHKFEVTAPCSGATPQIITVTFPAQSLSYNTYSNTGYCGNGSSTVTLGKFVSYFYSQDTYIPGGSRITFVSGPNGADLSALKHAYPNPFVMPSNTSKYFTPFDADFTSTGYTDNIVTPGTYTFDVWDAACQQTYRVSMNVPSIYTLSGFGYTSEHTSCSNMNIYPRGQIKYGTTNQTTYFKINSAKNANGTTMASTDYDTRTITQGQYLSLYKNGTYLIQVSAGTGSSCYSDTLSVTYEQPTPTLVLAKTASYVCNGKTKGYIILEAIGGYGNGPYEYEIVGTNPLQKNTTGIFNYGTPNENLTIKITDKSSKATQFGCSPNFEQKITMLDLKEASVAYSTNNGNFCVGQTIQLNCISLGNTTYDWKGPNGFTQTGQFLTIPNADLTHTGWYYVSVLPENCGDEKKDSIFINVHALPVLPSVLTPDIKLCYNSGSYSLVTISGASASSGNTLKWYSADGVTVITTPSVNSYTNTKLFVYYVSQVNNTTGCESNKVKITVSIMDRPGGPVIKYHPPVCYKDLVYITVDNSNPAYSYRLYTASSGGTILGQKTGNGSDLQFDPIEYTGTGTSISYYVSAVDPVTGCESTRSGQVVSRKASALSTDIIVAPDTICSGTSAKLIASAPGITNPIFRWYNGTSTTSTLLYTTPIGDSTYTTPNITSGTYYYVSVQGDNICENLYSQRKSVYVRVLGYTIPSYITASNSTICQNESATINLTSSYVTNNPVFNWYTSQTETIPFFTGNNYTTPPLSAVTTNYYIGASGYNQYCENQINNRKVVTVTTVSKAEVTAPETCPNIEANITVTNARANVQYKVYDQSTTGGNLLGSGQRTTAGSLNIPIGIQTSSNTFYVQTNDSYCASKAFTPFNLIIKDAPTVYEDIRLQICPVSGAIINLNGYLDQREFQNVGWSNTSGITMITGNSIDAGLLAPNKVYKFNFNVKNSCYERVGTLYIKALDNSGTSYYVPKTMKVCKDYASMLNLVELMGIVAVAGGVWDFSTLAPDYTQYIKYVNGAVLFDGEKAFADMKGDVDPETAGARKFDFIYTIPPNSCNTPTQQKLTIIITPFLL